MAADTLDSYDAVFWPFGPNWRAGVEEQIEFDTDVMRSVNGNEQRVQLRTKARRSCDFDFMAARSNSRLLDRTLWGGQNKRLAMPLWQYRSNLTSGALLGATALAFDHSLLGVSVGSLVAMVASPTSWEFAEVASLGSGVVNLTAPLAAAWPAGTRVYPAMLCQVQGSVPLVRQTDNTTTGRLKVLGDPLYTDPFLPTVAAPITYAGYEVLLTRPNWAGGIEGDSQYEVEVVDQETGAIGYAATTDTPQPQRSFAWLLKSRQAAYDFRGFLKRRNGRQKAFYAPSWNEDFTLVNPIGAADTQIRVKDDGFVDLIGLDNARRQLMIRRRNGTYYFRQINAVAADGADALLTLSSSLGASLSLTDCKSIHLMSLFRLASDAVAIRWASDAVATVDTPLVLVKS